MIPKPAPSPIFAAPLTATPAAPSSPTRIDVERWRALADVYQGARGPPRCGPRFLGGLLGALSGWRTLTEGRSQTGERAALASLCRRGPLLPR